MEKAILAERSKDFTQAIAIYKQLSADGNELATMRLLHCLDKICDWKERQEVLPVVRQILQKSSENFPLCYVSEEIDHELWNRILERRQWKQQATASNEQARDNRRIKIGYFSVDFLSHSNGQNLLPVIDAHDQEYFAIYLYHWCLEDEAPDLEISSGAIVRQYRPGDTGRAMEEIQADNLDIFIDTTRHIDGRPHALLAERLGSVGISAWGYGRSLATPALDYLITDAWMTPKKHRSYYAERLIVLPAYVPPARLRGRTRKALKKYDLGHQAAIRFGIIINSYKLNQAFFEAAIEITRRSAGILVVGPVPNEARNNLRTFALTAGLAEDQLIFQEFVSREEHLDRIGKSIDVLLDCPFMGGSAAVVEALERAIPVVTICGNSFESRSGASILASIGEKEWIASDYAEFIEKAIQLGELRILRGYEPGQSDFSAVFNPQLYSSYLEKAYLSSLDAIKGHQTKEDILIVSS